MIYDCDVALLGTGLAPLVAAKRLVEKGQSVLVVNPDWDFFLENSELPMDPLGVIDQGDHAEKGLDANRLRLCANKEALKEIRPDFPGPIYHYLSTSREELDAQREQWKAEVHDWEAPHLRSRNWLWLRSDEVLSRADFARSWELAESMFVHAAELGWGTKELEGALACNRFPGFSGSVGIEGAKGLLFERLVDVDVSRYRNGFLEFLREQTQQAQVVRAASQIQIIPDGLRFYLGNQLYTSRVGKALMVYWTPRLNNWVSSQLSSKEWMRAYREELREKSPKGVRIWEEWTLVSRETIDPTTVGVYGNSLVWAPLEGMAESQTRTIKVLMPGQMIPFKGTENQDIFASTGSSESLGALRSLCIDFLKWERFSIRSLFTRGLFEWPTRSQVHVPNEKFSVHLVCGSDGPLVQVVKKARGSVEEMSDVL